MDRVSSPSPRRTPRTISHVPLIQREIERLIGTGELTGGVRINESALALKLGISRGPVREACRALEQIGLLRSELNRGFFVREINTKEALDLYDIRAGLFGTAGRLAASIITTSHLRLMDELIGRMDAAIEAADIATFYTLNNEFHRQVVMASDNAKLIELYPLLEAELHLFRRRGLVLPGSMRTSNDEHKAILEALRQSDGTTAARLLERHILAGKARFLRTLEDDAAMHARLSPLDPKTPKFPDR
ncbi:transcriptional regulator, GntR family [Ancylobacter novellus DSM 506]|uniref:Transcriptional regulator, GntR family n=1 Tax=Ancylobacter novellus (strain ATCC 8093 / DSM 506 / JCM 20403 / CCM 1077 / IAM 12100 / NBRC 12443 / NCIMB 10456) TaxID=639283 RepID=D7AAA8_ANCN5|nr:FCD domain-containing protein [Ancylobacter novellus]ADH88911.1 transcriptional regulator, GntR family [Ancylobacter novellus DSM 506]